MVCQPPHGVRPIRRARAGAAGASPAGLTIISLDRGGPRCTLGSARGTYSPSEPVVDIVTLSTATPVLGPRRRAGHLFARPVFPGVPSCRDTRFIRPARVRAAGRLFQGRFRQRRSVMYRRWPGRSQSTPGDPAAPGRDVSSTRRDQRSPAFFRELGHDPRARRVACNRMRNAARGSGQSVVAICIRRLKAAHRSCHRARSLR
jgi:hypothetical protein